LPALVLWLLIALVVAPALILGFVASPWFFVILFLLPLLAVVPLATRKRGYTRLRGGSDGAEKTGLLVLVLVGPALVLSVAALILGILASPYAFLIVLLMVVPLIFVAFAIGD
jgi:hypothetical protein